MIIMFGKTEDEILKALEFYESFGKKIRHIVIHYEYTGYLETAKLETWSDKGLTLWVNDKIVYQHKK